MDYPATQRFVNDEEEDEEDEEKDENDPGTPLRTDNNVKIGTIVTDSDTYSVFRGDNKIGRLDTCSIIIDHSTISKEHAEIEAGLGSKSTFISDLGSLNKTKLNDVILRPGRSYQLQNGDVLRFGSVKAVYKTEEIKKDKFSGQSKEHVEFIIPETPLPNAKDARSVIPDTPDHSFEGSTTEANQSSDVSLIAGTQEGGDVGRRTSPILSGKSAARGLSQNLDLNEDSDINKLQDISELETQNDVSIDDSDEENIFDMMTQQSSIHDEETQKFSDDRVQTVVPTRFTVDQMESNSIGNLQTQKFYDADGKRCSINDLETQKFSVDQIDSRSYAINDLETQKFPPGQVDPRSYSINDLETQKFPAEQIRSRSDSIHELETQKFPAVDKKQSSRLCSINDLETQKFEAIDKNNEDSETDEEGMFEDSGEVEDMFDAPTQVIRAPRKVSKSASGTREQSEEENKTKNKIVERKNETEKVQAIIQIETPDIELNENEKITAKLNDSIESKLNHMFDEVNETGVDEPTQMLTQHLENILETTQCQESEVHQHAGEILITKNGDEQALEPPNQNKHLVDESDDESDAKSYKKEWDEPLRKSKTPDLQLMSTQELFGDLPAVVFLHKPSSKKDPKIEETKGKNNSKDAEVQKVQASRSKSENHLNKSKRAGSTESGQSVDSKRSKRIKNAEPKVTDKPVEEITVSKTRSRVSSARKLEELSSEIEEQVKPVTKKNLPIKKHGSSIIRDPQTVIEVVSTTRIATRSNAKTPIQTAKRSRRLSPADSPKISESKPPSSNSMIIANPKKVELSKLILPDKNETTNKNRKATRARKTADVTWSTNLPSKIESVSNKRSRNKPLDTSNETTEEEVTPIKRLRIVPKSKRKVSNSNDEKISESPDSGINQNESLPTRSRRARPTPNTSSNDNSSSTFGVESFDNTAQPSLESQEIQAILGIGNQGIEDNRGSSTSRYRKELKNVRCRRPVIGFGTDKEEDRQDFLSLPKTEIPKENVKDKFEKPVKIPDRKKRQVRQPKPKLDASQKKDVETSNKRPKPRSKMNTEAAEEENLKNEPENQKTPTSQGTKRAAPRRTVDRAEKENVVAETPSKRGRKRIAEPISDEKVKTSQLSPLRRGRSSLATPTSAAPSSNKIKHKILFTGLNDPRLISIVQSLGGTITEKPNDCTALVTDKVRRTYKFLCAMAMAVPIVSVHWLNESEKKGRFLETGDFLLEDPAEEAKFKFNLRQSLAKATGDKLLEGYTIILTPNTAPPPNAEMKGIIQACGGKALVRPPTKWPEKSLVISRQEDIKNAKKFMIKAPKSVNLVSVEFILTGILRHELNFKEHKLEII